MTVTSLLTETLHWFTILLRDLKTCRSLFYLLIAALLVSFMTGIALYLIDVNIHSPLDGIWSAWVTMTHVGFGDVVPVSFFGRLLAALLILFGLTLFSLFTAILSATLIGKNIATWEYGVQQIEQETTDIELRENLILQELYRLHQRMDVLEQQLLNRAKKL